MTFATAERAHEAAERADYSALQEDDDERLMVEEQIISGYLTDAWSGKDDDWIVSDSNRTNTSLAKILAVVRDGDADPRIQVDAIRSIILAMQAAGAVDQVEHLSAKGVI